MVIGPLGLALTNSTCALRPAPTSMLPTRSGPSSRMAVVCCASHASLNQKLRKPGPATSTLLTKSAAGRWPAMASATVRGAIPAGFASCSATGTA